MKTLFLLLIFGMYSYGSSTSQNVRANDYGNLWFTINTPEYLKGDTRKKVILFLVKYNIIPIDQDKYIADYTKGLKPNKMNLAISSGYLDVNINSKKRTHILHIRYVRNISYTVKGIEYCQDLATWEDNVSITGSIDFMYKGLEKCLEKFIIDYITQNRGM